MANPVLLVSGLGMMAVGIVLVLHWAKTRGVKATPVVLETILWMAAIALKAALD